MGIVFWERIEIRRLGRSQAIEVEKIVESATVKETSSMS